jgi:predicted lipoprotein with Yx(FWY)xxD motif
MCRSSWIPMEGSAIAGQSVDESLLGTIPRWDGTLQATYNGWPLYWYMNDFFPRMHEGQRQTDRWWVIDVFGNAVGM